MNALAAMAVGTLVGVAGFLLLLGGLAWVRGLFLPGGRAPGRPGPGGGGRTPLMFYGYWIVAAALVAQFVTVGAQISVVGVFLKPMTEELGWARSEFFYAETLGQFIIAGTGFVAGVYIDRYGARPLMLLGAVIACGALALLAEVDSLWQWIVVRGVFFMFGGALAGNMVVNVTVNKWFVRKRGRALGIASMGVSLAGVLWPPVMTAVSDEIGWRAAWRVLALVSFLLLAPAALLMRKTPEAHGLLPDGVTSASEEATAEAAADFANSLTRREALRTATLYVVIVCFGLAVVGVFVILSQTIPFLTDEGFSRSTAALMATSMSLPALVSKPAWGLLLEKFDARPMAAAGFALSAAAAIVILAAAKAGNLPLLTLGYVMVGTGFGGQIPIQEVIWASFFGRRYLGAVRGVALPFSFGIAAASPLAVAFYFDRVGNYDGAFYAISALWVVSTLLVLFIRRPRKPGSAAPLGSEGALAG